MNDLQIKRRILTFLFPVKNDIRDISAEIIEIKKEMELIYLMENKVEAIVRLIKYLTEIQDEGGFADIISKLKKKNDGQLNTVISTLSCLQIYFSFKSHVRRLSTAKFGEEITADNVHFGGINGYKNLPASYWLANQKYLEKEQFGSMSMWNYINNYLAGSFVRSQALGIQSAINELQKAILQSEQIKP